MPDLHLLGELVVILGTSVVVALRDEPERLVRVRAPNGGAVTIEFARRGQALCIAVRLLGAGPVDLPAPRDAGRPWRLVLSTESPDHAADARTVTLDASGPHPAAMFVRPGAVALEA